MMAKVSLSADARDMGLSITVLRQMQQTSRQGTRNGRPLFSSLLKRMHLLFQLPFGHINQRLS